VNLREALQIEIWSKRTSRKILIIGGMVIALLLLAYGFGYEIEIHWLTQGEHDTARAALQQIDALQDARSLSDEEFEILAKQAEAKVKAAEDSARTSRDEVVAMQLGVYLIASRTSP
jgi:uncharacterized protein HemX